MELFSRDLIGVETRLLGPNAFRLVHTPSALNTDFGSSCFALDTRPCSLDNGKPLVIIVMPAWFISSLPTSCFWFEEEHTYTYTYTYTSTYAVKLLVSNFDPLKSYSSVQCLPFSCLFFKHLLFLLEKYFSKTDEISLKRALMANLELLWCPSFRVIFGPKNLDMRATFTWPSK